MPPHGKKVQGKSDSKSKIRNAAGLEMAAEVQGEITSQRAGLDKVEKMVEE